MAHSRRRSCSDASYASHHSHRSHLSRHSHRSHHSLRSRRSQIGPKLALRILLDDGPDHSYTSGGAVSGKVQVEYSQEGLIDALQLFFKGDIHTFVPEVRTTNYSGPNGETYTSTQTIRHEHSVFLFDLNQTLVDHPWKLPSDVYEWPFEFIFPEFAEPNDRGDTFPLPPTFSVCQAFQGSATIKYELVARLHYKELSNTTDPVETGVSLSFYPPGRPRIEPKLIAHFLKKQREKNRRFRPKPHTFKQSLLHCLTMREDLRTPCVRFVPILWMPDTLTVGQPFSMTIAIDYMRERVADPASPEFVLKGLSVELSYATFWGHRRNISSALDRRSILYMNPSMEEPMSPSMEKPTVISGIRMPREGLQCFDTPLVKRSAYLRTIAIVYCRSLCYPPVGAKPFHLTWLEEVEVVGQPDKQAAKSERSVRLSSSIGSFGTVRRHPGAN